ncbi:hypothetical protein Tco_1180972 [Tanacetum coccineum]
MFCKFIGISLSSFLRLTVDMVFSSCLREELVDLLLHWLNDQMVEGFGNVVMKLCSGAKWVNELIVVVAQVMIGAVSSVFVLLCFVFVREIDSI